MTDVVIACLCGRHETDTVTLRDSLDFRAATAVRSSIGFAKIEDPDASDADILAVLREQYVLYGVEGWSLLNGKGPLAVTKPNIREHLLSDIEAATAVAEVADSLYSPKVVLPLLRAASASSQPGPMAASTSARKAGPPRRRTRYSPSLTVPTPTDDIETTTSPPAGASSS